LYIQVLSTNETLTQKFVPHGCGPITGKGFSLGPPDGIDITTNLIFIYILIHMSCTLIVV